MGATATVWRARDRRSGGNVCVKRLHPRLAADRAARERLRQEAALATRVDHPGVPAVVESADEPEESPALVFPYIEGESLAVRLKRDGHLPPAKAARIAARVAEALAAVHASGVVHRDIKPSNILLAANGEVSLLDFGIAEQTGTAGIEPLPPRSATPPGSAMTVGTLPYVGPQQLAGLPVAPSDDIWALGAVLYEMLAGRPPYQAVSATDLANAQASAPRDLPDAPMPLARIAQAALSNDPAARPSAAAFAATLDSWLAAGSSPDSPTIAMTAAIPVAAPPRRRLGLGAVLTAVAAVVVGLAVTAALALGPDWTPAAGNGLPPASDMPVPIKEPAINPASAPSVEPTAEPARQPESEPQADGSNAKPKNPGNDGNNGSNGNKGKGKKKGQR